VLTLRPYAPADAAAWDALVARSRTGNLLHRRGYMDYHADRFTDCSLIVEREGELVGAFPASCSGRVVTSHGGLTYAGLLSTSALRAETTLAVFTQMAAHYRAAGMRRVLYKAVPWIFHAYPAEEDLYALHRLGARLVRRDLSSVVALREGYRLAAERRRDIRHAREAGVRIETGGDLAAFHALLAEVLQRHEAKPTHSLDELRLLQARFPQQIVLYTAHLADALQAGALIYDFGHVVHTQYLAASEDGRHSGALSLLLGELVGSVYADRRYFSFGISTEHEGRVLNGGLAAQKERFGARAVVHDFYEWPL
jgi:Acetyltransferase (GNAT) domain